MTNTNIVETQEDVILIEEIRTKEVEAKIEEDQAQVLIKERVEDVEAHHMKIVEAILNLIHEKKYNKIYFLNYYNYNFHLRIHII